MSTLLLTSELVARVDNNSTKSSGNSAAGFYAAEAGLNLRAKTIRAKFEGYNLPNGTSPSTTSSNPPCINGNIGSGDFICDSSLTIQDYLYPNDTSKRIPVSTYVVDQNTKVNGVSQPTSVTINTGEPFAGLNAQEYRYDVSSTSYDRITNQPSAFLGIRFKSRLVPLFQFAAFYQQDLDYTYPPNMTMNGPIHTNGSMYLDSASGSTLTLNGSLSMAGQFFRGERVDGTCNGTVNIFSPIPTPGGLQSLSCGGTARKQYLQADVTPTWGANQIKVGIPSLTLPSTNTFNSDSTGYYWSNAQLRVVLKLDNSENPTGIEVQSASGTTDTTATNNLLGSACAPTTTTLSGNEAATDTNLGVSSSTNFRLSDSTRDLKDGPALQLEPSGTTSYVNNSAIDNDSNVVVNARSSSTSMTIRRQLGKAFNPGTGTVVRNAVVWTSNTFWNYREKYNPTNPQRNDAKPIRMLNVDMRRLITCANQLMGGKQLDDTTNGGLVWFFTVKGPKSANDVTQGGSPNTYGIRLYNGAILASNTLTDPVIKGLTVVSDQAVYVRGDYNCEWDDILNSSNANLPYGCSTNPSYTSNPPSGTTLPFKNTNPIYNKKPAAILADTINVLSNAWPLDDSYSAFYSNGLQIANPNVANPQPDSPVFIYSFDTGTPGGSAPPNGTALRLATDTTINAAFLAGIDLTGGGLNNYPRFQEDWYNPGSGARATLTYRGSMVSLGLPKRVNGPFCGSGTSNGTGGCNIYTPPFRNWDYDTDFNNAASLPPLTPRFVYLRQERFSRDYNRTSFLPGNFPLASIFPTSIISTLPRMQFRF